MPWYSVVEHVYWIAMENASGHTQVVAKEATNPNVKVKWAVSSIWSQVASGDCNQANHWMLNPLSLVTVSSHPQKKHLRQSSHDLKRNTRIARLCGELSPYVFCFTNSIHYRLLQARTLPNPYPPSTFRPLFFKQKCYAWMGKRQESMERLDSFWGQLKKHFS